MPGQEAESHQLSAQQTWVCAKQSMKATLGTLSSWAQGVSPFIPAAVKFMKK